MIIRWDCVNLYRFVFIYPKCWFVLFLGRRPLYMLFLFVFVSVSFILNPSHLIRHDSISSEHFISLHFGQWISLSFYLCFKQHKDMHRCPKSIAANCSICQHIFKIHNAIANTNAITRSRCCIYTCTYLTKHITNNRKMPSVVSSHRVFSF